MRHAARLLVLLVAVPAFAAEPAPDRAALTEQVRAVEIAFAKSVVDNQPERFASFLDEGTVFVSGSNVTKGKAAVIESWKGFFGADRPLIDWRPEIVELSADGTLGLSRGPWTIHGKDKEGKPVERSGVFNSVWRHQADGTWKIVFDAGCSPCPACG